MKTRNIIAILAALPIAAAFTACSSDEVTEAKPAKEMLIVEGSIIELPADQKDEPVSVQVTSDCHWRVTYDSGNFDKLTVQPSEGRGNGTLYIQTDKNTTLVNRTATITLTSDGGLHQKVTVRQTSSDAAMGVSDDKFNFEAIPTAAQHLAVTSNISWTIQLPSGIDWLHLDKLSGDAGATVLNISADEIQTDEDRMAVFSILYGGKSCQVEVTQKGKTSISLGVSANRLEYFSATGGKQSFRITSNGAWRALVPSTAQSWLFVEPASAVGDGEGIVRCEPNYDTRRERLSVVIVTAGTKDVKQEDVLVQQERATYPTISTLTYNQQTMTSSEVQLTFGYESKFPLTDYGLCYSTTNAQPTINDTKRSLGNGGTSDGNVAATLSGLLATTEYHVRAYAISPVIPEQVIYSNVVTFVTESTEAIIPSSGDNPFPQPARKW